MIRSYGCLREYIETRLKKTSGAKSFRRIGKDLCATLFASPRHKFHEFTPIKPL